MSGVGKTDMEADMGKTTRLTQLGSGVCIAAVVIMLIFTGGTKTALRREFHRYAVMRLTLCTLIFALAWAPAVLAQPFKRNPTPQDYVERNGGGATMCRTNILTYASTAIM